MELKNKKFQELVKKMETLKETEKGHLKGGFAVLEPFSNDSKTDPPHTQNYFQCGCNNYCKPKRF